MISVIVPIYSSVQIFIEICTTVVAFCERFFFSIVTLYCVIYTGICLLYRFTFKSSLQISRPSGIFCQ